MRLDAARRMLRKTRILRGPTRRLAAFGATRIRYRLISPVEDLKDRSRLREGLITAEKPKILTAELLRERFEGFDEEARAFGEWLLDAQGDRLRALEYRFKNEPGGARVLRSKPRELAERVLKDLEEAGDAAVLLCPDAGWQIALLKVLLEESHRSFAPHLREFESKGLFRTGDERRRDEIEGLFRRAASDRSTVRELGAKLKEYGLFEAYQDRFFALL